MSGEESWAANDYEPTPEEIDDIFAPLYAGPPGDHGFITFVASIERYIWGFQDIYWGNRQVDEDGRVTFCWIRR